MELTFLTPLFRTVTPMGLALLLTACAGTAGAPSTPPQAPPGSPVATPPALSGPAISAVQEFPDQGTDHLPDGETFAYNSNPPTSGPHARQFVPRWGVYNQLIPKEVLVHNMEHGGVIVWFNCQTPQRPLSEADCNRLHQQIAGVVQPLLEQNKNVVVAQYHDMEHRIAMTAWTKLQTLSDFNDQAIRAFIERYDRAYNPEGF